MRAKRGPKKKWKWFRINRAFNKMCFGAGRVTFVPEEATDNQARRIIAGNLERVNLELLKVASELSKLKEHQRAKQNDEDDMEELKELREQRETIRMFLGL